MKGGFRVAAFLFKESFEQLHYDLSESDGDFLRKRKLCTSMYHQFSMHHMNALIRIHHNINVNILDWNRVDYTISCFWADSTAHGA